LSSSLLIAALLSSSCSGFGPVAFFHLQLGWYSNSQAWHICTDTNNIRYATTKGLTLAPNLSDALTPNPEKAARPMYAATNVNQPPVFSTAPGQPDYSGLWQIVNVTWKPGFARYITNSDPADPITNPTGVPPASQADIAETQIVLDYPILAIGALGGPWFPPPPEAYRIPQVVLFHQPTRTVGLPIRFVFSTNFLGFPIIAALLVTDVSDPELAATFGANLAPALLHMPQHGTQRLYEYNPPKPALQLEVLAHVQDALYLYSPVTRFTVVDRSDIPQSTIIQTEIVQLQLTGAGKLQIVRDDQRMNTPAIPQER
jgi:hypothetical protein